MLALLAGGGAARAASLGLGMLLLQFTIGATNDLFDQDLDARSKPWKPIPSRIVTPAVALAVAFACATVSLGIAAAHGPVVVGLAGGMLGAGIAYNIFLKRGSWAWLAYAFAFPLLPLYAWFGASGTMPPAYELLLPLAALAGPALQLANGVVDMERDRAAGLVTLAGRLGHSRTMLAMAAVLLAVHGTAWATVLLTPKPELPVLLILGSATALAAAGWRLSAATRVEGRERGWQLQALAVALLALGWLVFALDKL